MSKRSPLNIALIRKCYDPEGGGAEKVMTRFVDEFLQRGHKITFYGEKFNAIPTDRFQFVQVPKSRLCTSGTTGFHRQVQKILKTQGKNHDVIYSLCRTFPVDVFRVTEQIHAEWLPRAYSPMAMLNPRHIGLLSLERKCFKPNHVQHVVTNSSLVRNQVISRFHFPQDRISVVPNGVDPEVFHPVTPEEKQRLRQELKLDKNKMILLYVAANFKTKKLDWAIEALGAVNFEHKENMVLVVTGGDSPAPYRQRISESGINVKFTGKISDMASYYRAADLLYFPSPYEPFANVCLEAAACGLPVLTTEQNGSSEIVEHGKSGYVVSDYKSAMEIRHNIVDFFDRAKHHRQEMSENIYQRSLDYTWENHADMLEDIFYNIKASKN